MASNLDSFIQHSKPQPSAISISKTIQDRESTFIGYLYRASSLQDSRAAVNHLKRVTHAGNAASHYISAWRFMRAKPGLSGLDVNDFTLESGCLDDGEQWAGAKVLKAMEAAKVLDAVVIVARWYGGVQLGPARFTHIYDTAFEVSNAFVLRDEIEDSIATLYSLDESVAEVRAQIAELEEPPAEGLPSQPAKVQDYEPLLQSLDVAKARRLVAARENALKSVKGILAKRTAAT